jgi:predicted nucleic acid-binding protein
MAPVVIYDASVLYPNTLRDLLLRLANMGLVRAKWTDQILDEMFTALMRDRPDLDLAKLARTRKLMSLAVRDWRVTGYESLIGSLRLPDPDDRHVLAAGIRSQAKLIVTANLRHFPVEVLRVWNIEPKSPDEFVRDRILVDRMSVFDVVGRIADSWRNPPGTVDDVLNRLERCGLVTSAAELRATT